MKPGVQLVLVGLLAAGAGLGGGYFLWGGSGATEISEGGESLAIGRSPLRISDSPTGGSGQKEEGAEASSSGEGDLAFLHRNTERAAIEDILKKPGPMGRWTEMMRLALEGSDEEIVAALEQLQDLPNGIDTIVSKFFLYSRYSEGDPASALAVMKDLPDEERHLAEVSILGGWAGEDPLAAAAYLESFADEEGNLEGVGQRSLGGVVNEWARSDPKAAMEWSLSLGERTRGQAISMVLQQWSWRDPEAAAAVVEGLPEDEHRKNYAGTVAHNWAQRDYAGALAWAETLSGEERGRAQSVAVREWADHAPVEAAGYATAMEEGDGQNAAIRSVAQKWAEQDAAAAGFWVVTELGGEAQAQAMNDVVWRWAKQDSMAASSFVADLPPGPVTDRAIVALAGQVVGKDIEGAAIWLSTISNSKERENHVTNVATRWMKKDPAAARAWIATAPISEERREKLLGD